jgi:hypothetical protein
MTPSTQTGRVTDPSVGNAGTVFFVCDHPHIDWLTNGDDYDFSDVSPRDGVAAKAHKIGTGTMELGFEIDGRTLEFHVPVHDIRTSRNPRAPHAVSVGLSWNRMVATLYLNAEVIENRRLL